MKTLKNIFDFKTAVPEKIQLFYRNLNWAAFDIETTGLNRETSSIILTGFAQPLNDGRLLSVQYFAEALEDEEAVIKASLEYMSKLDFLVTFNGAAFDMGFLTRRMNIYGFDAVLPHNLDMYRVAKSSEALKNQLPDMKQKTIEIFLGLGDRTDEISGAESVNMYFDYLETGSQKLEDLICLHNRDDVVQLCKILPLVDEVDFGKFLIRDGFRSEKYTVEKIELSPSGIFRTYGKIHGDPLFIEVFDDEISFRASFLIDSFEINLKLENIGDFSAISDTSLSKIAGIEKSPYFIEDIRFLRSYQSLSDGYLICSNNGKPNCSSLAWLGKYLIERTIERWKTQTQ